MATPAYVPPRAETRASGPTHDASESGERLSRALDICIALLAIAFFAPLMLVVALAVSWSGGPVFFRQSRIGRGGIPFTCLKFRTMHVDGDEMLARLLAENPLALSEWERDRKLVCDPRVTAVGAILRKTSLDELPQLFNVLRGSMSIVGPRPIVDAEVLRYGRYFDAYCRVRPGITGLWQISGRSGTSYRRRVACDVTYVRSKSAYRDVQIIMKTIPAVCLARGAY
ncbi:sugar transferase [uncultured Sphingomonas sp.]|uniref:sugar transferase n=1 Tax=uncultured Sphingomonas sp. TaxID=158754 RepID=UPI0035C99C29